MGQRPTAIRSRGWRNRLGAAVAAGMVGVAAGPALAQGGGSWGYGQYAPGPSGAPLWADQSAAMAQSAPILRFLGPQNTPPVVPVYESVLNPLGASATYQPGGATVTANNAFFASLGTNGRTCASCHAASSGWSMTPAQIQALFFRTGGTDPLFQPVDGANCSSVVLTNLQSQLSAYSLLLTKGLIRIFEALPAAPQYTITAIQDPYGCSTNSATGLTSYGANTTPAGFLSVYRRPLPATNLAFLSSILADGRETSLSQQAIDANRIHAQATSPPTSTQLAQILAFQEGLTSAQTYSWFAGDLTSNGAGGGPVPLASLPFSIGMNDPFANNPSEVPPNSNSTPFNQDVYSLYTSWAPGVSGYGAGFGWVGPARASIARGETIFNERQFTISGVTGLNDMLGETSITGTCSTCHDTPNAGSNSNFLMVDTGITTPGAPGVDLSGLPQFTLQCISGPLAGQTVTTTDPGRAILSGQCSDINRLKVPTLRNLAARPPYFHNGSAPTLFNVVNFYNARFSIGLSQQDQQDLVNFLNAL